MSLNPKRIHTPLKADALKLLRTGDPVLISGTLYTARDIAHKRMIQMLDDGKSLPVDLKNQILFYAGPAPAPPGQPTGSIGPTTACRMDMYTPRLLEVGLRGMIGKGERSSSVRKSMKQYGAVYFAAIGGIAALLAKCIIKSRIIAFEDLGPEAMRELEVIDFPVIVANDTLGGDLFEQGARKSKKI